jgi:hypothetical protein
LPLRLATGLQLRLPGFDYLFQELPVAFYALPRGACRLAGLQLVLQPGEEEPLGKLGRSAKSQKVAATDPNQNGLSFYVCLQERLTGSIDLRFCTGLKLAPFGKSSLDDFTP